MSNVKLTREEKEYLAATCPYLPPTYLDFLQGYCYNPNEVTIEQEGTELKIFVEGYWYRTILWEIPLLSIVSELYYKLSNLERKADNEVKNITKEKIEKYNLLGVTVAEFGTRRRHSYRVHQLVMEALKQYGSSSFVGSSNVHFAMRLNMVLKWRTS